MSRSDIAVSVRGLSKSYTIAHQGEKHVTLAEQLLSKARRPFARAPKETFWALKNVEFDIKKGDVVGIIGRNGAGKSTLLKILSRITEPTAGQIDLYGRVGSLLEVGTGFHPELTGRENVFLNGAILGMTKAEIRKQFDAIIDFAGVEQFLDTPVKRYSSGMYVRLAFAVAAHLKSEILVVDEVLAVGDAEFQRKCLDKMRNVAKDGRTVLFVSHDIQSILRLCQNSLILREGTIWFTGPVAIATEMYNATFAVSNTAGHAKNRPGSGEYRFSDAMPRNAVFATDECKIICFTIKRRRGAIGAMYLSAHFIDSSGVVVAQCDSRLVGCWIQDAELYSGTVSLAAPWLKPGSYRVDLFLCVNGFVDQLENACMFSVSGLLPYAQSGTADAFARCSTLSDFQWNVAPGVAAQEIA